METFLWTLAAAAVTGLAWIAYKHPAGFAKNIFPRLIFWPTMVVASGTLVYMLVAVGHSHKLLAELANNPDEIPWRAKSVAGILVVLSQAWLIYLAYAAFLFLLRFLPNLLEGDDSKTEKSDS